MGEQDKSRDFRFNLDLVMTEIARWPVVTLVIMTIFAIAIVLQPPDGLNVDALTIAVAIAGYLFGLLGMKAMFLVMVYPRLQGKPFPGSLLVANYFILIPIFVFYAAGFYVLTKDIDEEAPLLVLIPFMLFSYMLFVIFLTGFMRALHTIFTHSGKLSDLTRDNR